MARQLRAEYPGAIYHVMNRGDRREPIFRDDTDRERFVETLGEACARSAWQVHALCLMPNHFHLVLETPQPTLVEGMKWFLGTYTGRFNRRHQLFGHLFSGRYKSLVVDGSGTGYLKTVCDYVHLNPARAKLLQPEQGLREYRWSEDGGAVEAGDADDGGVDREAIGDGQCGPRELAPLSLASEGKAKVAPHETRLDPYRCADIPRRRQEFVRAASGGLKWLFQGRPGEAPQTDGALHRLAGIVVVFPRSRQ